MVKVFFLVNSTIEDYISNFRNNSRFKIPYATIVDKDWNYVTMTKKAWSVFLLHHDIDYKMYKNKNGTKIVIA